MGVAYVVEFFIICTDSVYNLGSAWAYLGALRFHLLLNPVGPDPVIKYTIRHAELLEKISLLELEIKVLIDLFFFWLFRLLIPLHLFE